LGTAGMIVLKVIIIFYENIVGNYQMKFAVMVEAWKMREASGE